MCEFVKKEMFFRFAELNFKLVMARTGVNLAKGLLCFSSVVISDLNILSLIPSAVDDLQKNLMSSNLTVAQSCKLYLVFTF